jgi:prolyl-tRNA editing enzyme YbaK/EbsC (Cys-tRNA(Pro) deacylase)
MSAGLRLTESGHLSPSAARVQEVLDTFGLGLRVVELTAVTRTVADAAAAIGCTGAQIAKSLIFKTSVSGRPILVVASGVNRVNEKVVARRLAERIGGEQIVCADAPFVRAATGFAIGGVPPVGHVIAPVVLIDRDLMGFDVIWAAAGTPNAVFRIAPPDLARITGGAIDAVG